MSRYRCLITPAVEGNCTVWVWQIWPEDGFIENARTGRATLQSDAERAARHAAGLFEHEAQPAIDEVIEI